MQFLLLMVLSQYSKRLREDVSLGRVGLEMLNKLKGYLLYKLIKDGEWKKILHQEPAFPEAGSIQMIGDYAVVKQVTRYGLGVSVLPY